MTNDPDPAVSGGSPPGLRLMTYNLNRANRDVDATLDAIANARPDVVLLQEVTERWGQALERRFRDAYPHREVHVGLAGGIAVLSTYPILAEELWPPPPGTGAWFPAQRVVIHGPSGHIQILNVHLRPATDGGSWIKGFITTQSMRREEIAAHWTRIARDLPTIVAGDFNEHPSGQAIEFLATQGLVRVHAVGPPTWRYTVQTDAGPSDVLTLDIDHVMIDRRFTTRDARVLDAGTSDHRPVIVTVISPPN